MFEPFKMPDFCSRPDGKSKTLKEAYIFLRRQELPDKSIFVFPQGEFSSFKGEILEQQPNADEMVYQDSRVTLIAAVPGISHSLPDLFTGQKSDFLAEDKNPRQGAKNLFAIFDSVFLKMRCRLDWIRDIYAGIYYSPQFADYQNSLFFSSEREAGKSELNGLGFILSRLSRYKGTESALQVLLESLTGLKVKAEIPGNRKIEIPADSSRALGDEVRLGDNLILGDQFESEKPDLRLDIRLAETEDVPKAIRISEDYEIINDICRKALPFYLGRFETDVDTESAEIEFTCGSSYLGFSTAVDPAGSERG